MDINKYGNVAIDQLHLVRVQDGLEGIRFDDGDLLITRNTQDTSELSMRNTVHFTLNGVVSNHAYGEFNSLFAFISPFEKTAQKNENLLAGLNPSDTFFHQDQNNELRLHKPILVAPHGAEIPSELTNSGLPIVRYDAPIVINGETLASTRDSAIANVFSSLNAPLHSIGMWGWANAPDPTTEQRQGLLNRLGYQEANIAMVHTGSPEDRVEAAIGAFAYHNKAILKGERLEDLPTGLQIPHTDMVDTVRRRMFKALSNIENESVRQKLTDKFKNIDESFQQQIADLSMDRTIPPPIPDWMDTSGITPPTLDGMDTIGSIPPPIPDGLDTSGITPPPPPTPQSSIPEWMFTPPPPIPKIFGETVGLNDADVKNLNNFFEQSGLSDKLDRNANELLSAPESLANKKIRSLFDSHHYNQLQFNVYTSLVYLRNQTALSNDSLDNPDYENNNQLIYDAYNDVKNELTDFNNHYLNLIQHIPDDNQELNMKYQLDLNKKIFNLTQDALGENQKTFNENGIEKSFSDDLNNFKDNNLKTIEKSLEFKKPNTQPTLDNSREYDLN